MFSLYITAGVERDELLTELWEAGTTGITEEEDGVTAFFDDNADIHGLARYQPVRQEDDGQDWAAVARGKWVCFAVGKLWWLAPEWDQTPPPAGRILLRIYPGMACGTGWHAATQLCLTAMEDSVVQGSRVLDVGTGSGILADAACLLGARPVWGCDIEHESTLVAKANTGGRIGLFTGSLRSVRSAAVDLVVANLNAPTLQRLARDVRRVLRPDGLAILSGFPDDETFEVEQSMEIAATARFEQDGWACLVFRYS